MELVTQLSHLRLLIRSLLFHAGFTQSRFLVHGDARGGQKRSCVLYRIARFSYLCSEHLSVALPDRISFIGLVGAAYDSYAGISRDD